MRNNFQDNVGQQQEFYCLHDSTGVSISKIFFYLVIKHFLTFYPDIFQLLYKKSSSVVSKSEKENKLTFKHNRYIENFKKLQTKIKITLKFNLKITYWLVGLVQLTNLKIKI